MSHLTSILLPVALLGACAPPDAEVDPLDLSDVPRTTERDTSFSGVLEVYFTQPGTEPGDGAEVELDDALVALIDAARVSVDLCLYEFKDPKVTDAVLAALERGVRVRFVGDGDETGDSGYLALEAAGVELVARPAGDRIMHNKFVVVDGQAVWTGSTNLTQNGIYRNNNHAVIIESSEMATEYTREFEQMYEGELFGRRKTDLDGRRSVSLDDQDVTFHFAPEHDPIQEMVALADSADHTLHFMVFAYTHPDLLDAMLRAQDRGVEVVGVFDESQARGQYSVDEQLAAAGVPVYIDGNHNASGFAGGKLHHKVMLVDVGVGSSDPVVTSGSFNWSKSATLYNDENLVEIRDPALHALYAREFCSVLEVATLHPGFEGEAVDPCERVPELFINEILPNPEGTDRGQEYVEIINGGQGSVDLSGWTFGDEAHATRHAFSGPVLGPGEGLVLFDRGDHSDVPGSVVSSSGLLGLNNTGDTLRLVDPTGAVVDEVVYHASTSGIALNRSRDLDPGSPLVRHDEVPGAVGVQSPGTRADGLDFLHVFIPDFQIVINEVLPDPAGTDRGQEYVELVNAGPDFAELQGFTLHDAAGFRHDFGGLVLAPGEAVVLFDAGDHASIPGAIISTTGSLSLNNTGDRLTLLDANREIHDTVSWTTSYPGESWTRTADGDIEADLERHSQVAPDGSLTSAGYQADGGSWD